MTRNIVRRTRYRLGRWLLRPQAERIIAHYNNLATFGEFRERCAYIAIGAKYVALGWPGHEAPPTERGQWR